MKKPLLIAALCAGLPACAAQDVVPAAGPVAARCPMPDDPPPASGALPARAGDRPAPHLGSVAPNSRVPSQVLTPSMRAMAAAGAAHDGQAAHVHKNPQEHCEKSPAPAASEGNRAGRGGG
ncbi:hypothetical protein [Massilia sp. SYSU DXS3249]